MATALEPTATEPTLPDRYEVVDGVIQEVPPMSAFSSEIANRLRDELTVYGRSSRLGRPRMDMQFRVPIPGDPTRNRAPDVAFITFERWPENRPLPYRGNPIDVVPDVVAEAISPTETAEDAVERALDFLRAGVRLVWVVYPRVRQVHAYTDPAGPVRVFRDTDALDGGDVLPGFSVPMAGLFPTPDALPEPTNDG